METIVKAVQNEVFNYMKNIMISPTAILTTNQKAGRSNRSGCAIHSHFPAYSKRRFVPLFAFCTSFLVSICLYAGDAMAQAHPRWSTTMTAAQKIPLKNPIGTVMHEYPFCVRGITTFPAAWDGRELCVEKRKDGYYFTGNLSIDEAVKSLDMDDSQSEPFEQFITGLKLILSISQREGERMDHHEK